MILVDIKVPSFDKNYDFLLDENTAIYNIIGEVSELISQKEHCSIVGDIEELMLCKVRDNRIMSINCTLSESGVKTGDSLILV